MTPGQFATRVACSLSMLVLTGSSASHVLAHDGHKQGPGAFVKVVREATERFRDVSVAENEGYGLLFGCVSGPDAGAMGLHYVKGSLVADGVLDPARPEILVYEPLPNGRVGLSARTIWSSQTSGTRRTRGHRN